MMTAKEYYKQTKRTWNDQETFKSQIDNASMGIVGEMGEFTQASEDREEAGDVFYYLATFFRLCGEKPQVIEPDNLEPRMVSVTQTLLTCTRFIEHVKKWVHHEKHAHKTKAIEEAKKIAGIMFALCSYREWNVRELWQENIAKLTGRWPDGFKPGDNSQE